MIVFVIHDSQEMFQVESVLSGSNEALLWVESVPRIIPLNERVNDGVTLDTSLARKVAVHNSKRGIVHFLIGATFVCAISNVPLISRLVTLRKYTHALYASLLAYKKALSLTTFVSDKIAHFGILNEFSSINSL